MGESKKDGLTLTYKGLASIVAAALALGAGGAVTARSGAAQAAPTATATVEPPPDAAAAHAIALLAQRTAGELALVNQRVTTLEDNYKSIQKDLKDANEKLDRLMFRGKLE